MLSLLSLGAVWIWFCSILVLESILLLVLIENDKPGWCTISMLSTLGLLKLLTGINLFSLAWHNPGMTVLAILGYFAAGTVWAVGKWYLYVKDRRVKYEEAKSTWSASSSLSARPNPTWETSYERAKFLNSKKGLAPLVRDNKSRVLTWMGYWPWSMVWTVINDPVKKAFKAIYNRIHNNLQAISNNAFKDAN